jgi:hypothetical protein
MAQKIAGVPNAEAYLFICDHCDREAFTVWLLDGIRVCRECRFNRIRRQWLVEAWQMWDLVGDEGYEAATGSDEDGHD